MKAASEPLYQIVHDALLRKIADGSLPPGGLLPNEFELAAEFGVSQGTARKAVSQLEAKGIIRRRQGQGSFVTLRTPEDSLFHFFRLRNDAGAQVVPELADETIQRRAATPKERRLLFDAPEEVFEIARLRTYQGAPLCLEECIVSAALFPGLDARAPLPNTLYVLFQRAYSCVIMSADDDISAVVVGPERADRLGVSAGTPALMAERQSRDILGRVVEIRQSLYLTENAHYASSIR